MTRPTLAQMLANGDLDRLFRQLGSWAAVAKHLGVHEATLRKVRRQARERLPEAWQALGERLQSVAAAPMQSVGERLECGCWAGRRHSKSNCKMGLPSDPEIIQERGLDFEDEEPTVPDGVPLPAIPPGHLVRGASTLVKPDGSIAAQWIKTRQADVDRHEAMLEALSGLAEKWQGLHDPTPTPANSNADLLATYMMGDPHIGLYAWAEETGNSFDLEIAERTLVNAADHLVSVAPAARQALVVNVGDFYHSDNSFNRTTRSGHALDVDTRWAKVLRVGIRTMRRIIDRALEKHETVRVINAIGNHDDHSAVMLSVALSQFYERDERVEIDTSPSKFHWHRFGANLIGVTHGDTVKAADLPGVMACDRAKDWGETLHRYWICGHIHHDTVKEYAGVTVETLRTMAARDNWSHAAGYRSGRDMKVDVYHREYGRITRHIVGVHQLEAA